MPKPSKLAESQPKSEAVRIGRTHAELARKLDERAIVLFAVPKTPGRSANDDAGQVLLGMYDYDRDQSLIALVDTKQEAVVSVRETDVQFQLSEEERHTAERIAGEDPRVRELLAGRNMNALTRLYFPPRMLASSKHRHAIVFLRPSKSERWYAVVDLTANRTVDIVSRRQLAGE